MNVLAYDRVVETVEKLVMETNYRLPADVRAALEHARELENSDLAVSILDQIIDNARIASTEMLPLCQDTGVAVFFADIGTGVTVDGDGVEAAIQEGTRRGYLNGALRMSIVGDPLRRRNTGDNTPAIVHCRTVLGEGLTIYFCPKGGGCENMSRLFMLSPAEGRDGIMGCVLETVRQGGGRPCPPIIAGVGLGGNFEYAALLAKRSLLRAVGERNPDALYADLETELVEKINGLGIGPMGLGGRTTALEVFIETAPCHIASLPVAVNIQCHAARHGKVVM